MARVLMPVMNRRYNHNPRGSSTSTVTMPSANPFEARVHIANGIPGMSGMGSLTPAPATSPVSAAPAAAPGFDWSALAQSLAQTGVQVGGQIGVNAINRRYGQLPAQGATPLPTQTNMRIAPASPGWLPWAIIGGAVVVGGGILLMLRGGKKRR